MPTIGVNRVAALQILKNSLSFVTAFAAGVNASIGQVLGAPGLLGSCGFVTHGSPSGEKSGSDLGTSKGGLRGLEIHRQSLERLFFRNFSRKQYLAPPFGTFSGKEKGSADS